MVLTGCLRMEEVYRSRRAIETFYKEKAYWGATVQLEDAVYREEGTGAGVVFRIDEFPDPETEREMGLQSPFDLLGLYSGVGLAHKSVTHPHPEPEMIYLYRRPLLDYLCETGEDLYHLVRHVLIHEAGHHFGFSDDDMDRLQDD